MSALTPELLASLADDHPPTATATASASVTPVTGPHTSGRRRRVAAVIAGAVVAVALGGLGLKRGGVGSWLTSDSGALSRQPAGGGDGAVDRSRRRSHAGAGAARRRRRWNRSRRGPKPPRPRARPRTTRRPRSRSRRTGARSATRSGPSAIACCAACRSIRFRERRDEGCAGGRLRRQQCCCRSQRRRTRPRPMRPRANRAGISRPRRLTSRRARSMRRWPSIRRATTRSRCPVS